LKSRSTRKKLRLRSYGVPKETDTVFRGDQEKIRRACRQAAYRAADAEGQELPGSRRGGGSRGEGRGRTDSQIGRERSTGSSPGTGWSRKHSFGYDRIATFSPDDPELRITYDFNIRSRENELDLTAGDSGDLLLPEGQVLMEIKTGSAYPLWLSNILSEGRIYPVEFFQIRLQLP
jgi:hypothetical protein